MLIGVASFLDELLVLLLALYGIKNYKRVNTKETRYAIILILFFLAYSLAFGVNTKPAIFLDFILFLKPLICFYVTYHVSLVISEKTRCSLKRLYIILFVYLLLILPFIDKIYTNTTAYYPGCLLCASSYLLFSEKKKNDWIIALIMLTPGLFTIRAKFFTIYILYVFIAFFLKSRIKFNVKWLVLSFFIAAVAIYVSWDKFNSYFILGVDETQARSICYFYSIEVIKDYFPFGPGFGSYCSEAAARYYSPLYEQYGMSSIWGLREKDYMTEADFLKDTFYPVLSQFGIIGIYLYYRYWKNRWNEGKKLIGADYRLFVFLFFVVLIQNIADNAFTGPTCVPLMMSIGLILNQMNDTKNDFVKVSGINKESKESYKL